MRTRFAMVADVIVCPLPTPTRSRPRVRCGSLKNLWTEVKRGLARACTRESTSPDCAGINRVQWTLVAPQLAPRGRSGRRAAPGGPAPTARAAINRICRWRRLQEPTT